MRNKQWQKHHKKDQTTANRITMFCFVFYEVGTAVWPREFYHGNLLLKQSDKKVPEAIPWFLRGKKTKHRRSIRRGLVFLMVTLPLFISHVGNFVMVDSPRFPKSSGIDPKKACLLYTSPSPRDQRGSRMPSSA